MKNEKNLDDIQQRVVELKKDFTSKLKEIDPNLIPQLRIIHAIDKTGHFSDWPDNWNDGDRWVKTWGKAGGDSIITNFELRIPSPIDISKRGK
jgi:hypothetical protein